MKDELREVEYTLEDSEELGFMDYGNDSKQEEATKQEKVYFIVGEMKYKLTMGNPILLHLV